MQQFSHQTKIRQLSNCTTTHCCCLFLTLLIPECWQITRRARPWYSFCRVNSAIRCTRYAGRFGNDDLDNAGFVGDVTTVAVPHISRRSLSRSSNAQQSWLTRADSFVGSISLLARSAMACHSSEYGFIAGLHVSMNTRYSGVQSLV